MILKIALGLLGFGIMVFVHELGHFLAARLVGIDVEAFSIGWGKAILKKKIGGVEYRLGMFPVGGYCKMKGENDYEEAWDKTKQGGIAKGHFLSVSPWRRIIVYFMGPFANLVLAVLILSIIWGIGFETHTLENRIVLVSAIDAGSTWPADEAGLETGDRIIEIKGQQIANYNDIQENIAINADALLPVKVERNGRVVDLEVRPALDKSTGAGRIGIYNWTEPVIGGVAAGSAAEKAELAAGDRILTINGKDFLYTAALFSVMQDPPEVLELEYERDNRVLRTRLLLPAAGNSAGEQQGSVDPGIFWETVKIVNPPLNPFAALAKGVAESWKTLTVSVRSLALLFKGIDLTQAVSGPIRITYMMGDIAAEGFGQSFGRGVSSMASFLALISIVLCIMNLLPLPIVDGGMIILHIIEGIRRKPTHPRAISILQTVGVVIIFGLMIFAVFGDILFLTRQ